VSICLIAAMSENGVIGRDGQLPWHLPADLRRFKNLTDGHAVVMGRRTFDSIGRPLPNRRNVVVTRNRDWAAAGATAAPSLDAALAAVPDDEAVFVVGGAEIYREALPRADRLELTIVHAEVDGDTWFPEIDLAEWTLVEEERHEADDRHEHAFTFRTYERPEQAASPRPRPGA
jgi:dihydrofolate reductase